MNKWESWSGVELLEMVIHGCMRNQEKQRKTSMSLEERGIKYLKCWEKPPLDPLDTQRISSKNRLAVVGRREQR